MENRKKVLEKLKAVRNFALESDDLEMQGLGNILNSVYLAQKNGDLVELMKLMAGFTMSKLDTKDDGNVE
jgi:hypothetical protein